VFKHAKLLSLLSSQEQGPESVADVRGLFEFVGNKNCRLFVEAEAVRGAPLGAFGIYYPQQQKMLGLNENESFSLDGSE